ARLTAGRFSLESPDLGLIRTKEGRIQLLGMSALPDRDTPFALEQLPMGRFHVRDAEVPRTLGHELRFSASVAGPLQDANALVSAFSVEGEELDLAGWADVFPDAFPAPETGHGGIELRGVLKGAELVELAADVDLSQV